MGTQKLNLRQNNYCRCLILGGGEIIDYAAIAAQLDGDTLVLCADSGFYHCEKLGVKPDAVIGDMDSIAKIPEDVAVLEYPAEKDYTDSTLAMRTAIEYGCKDIIMAGMLGGRYDHGMANLQNLAWCAVKKIKAKITDGATEIFAVTDGALVIEAKTDSYFSVFSLTTISEGVTVLGGKYPLDDYGLRFDDPRAVSNEFAREAAEISVRKGTVAVVVVL